MCPYVAFLARGYHAIAEPVDKAALLGEAPTLPHDHNPKYELNANSIAFDKTCSRPQNNAD
jgi:hypothetical protein